MAIDRGPLPDVGVRDLPASAPEEAASAVDHFAARRRAVVGSALLFSGIGLLGLLLVSDLPFPMPRSWYLDRPLWVAGGLIALVAGWYLLRDGDEEAGRTANPRHRAGGFAPGLGPAGPRFERLVLYSRAACHLCDVARETLAKYSAFLPPFEDVDIDADPALVARFSTCVPVVEIDGKVRFRGRVNEVLLRRLIAARQPRDTMR